MNRNSSAVLIKGIQSKPSFYEIVASNVIDKIQEIDQGSEITINVTTPVGTRFIGTSRFIGSHSDSYLFIELPNIAKSDIHNYFQPSFFVNIKALSKKGIGSTLYFKSKVHSCIAGEVPVLVLCLPTKIQISDLRKEPRFDVCLSGKLIYDDSTIECQIRDLSLSGCQIKTSPISRRIKIGETVKLEVTQPMDAGGHAIRLSAMICNSTNKKNYIAYGLKFDDNEIEKSKSLLSHLKVL